MTPTRSFGLPPARRFTGLLALLLATVYVVDAWQTLSVGRWHKPGAAIFPIAVGALLALSAISVLLEKHGGADDSVPATFSLPAGSDLRRLLLVLAAFASMWLLSDDPGESAPRLAIYAVVIALSFEVFFVRLLKVQMPAGVFRQWLF